MSINPQKIVFISPEAQAGQKYASWYTCNPGYFHLGLNTGSTSETCLVILLELCVAFLQQQELNKTKTFSKRRKIRLKEYERVIEVQTPLRLPTPNFGAAA